MKARYAFWPAVALAAVLATGCGGSSTPATSTVTTTSTSIPASGAGVTFPTANNISNASFGFPASTFSGSLSLTATTGTAGPQAQSGGRQTQAVATSQLAEWQVQFTGATGTLTFNAVPTFTIPTPTGSVSSLVLEIFDTTQTGSPLLATWAGTISGTNTVFTGASGLTLNLADTLWFEIVGGSATTAGGPILPGPGTSSGVTYAFGGSSTTVSLSATSPTPTLSAYKGLSVAFTEPSLGGSGTLTLSDATNSGDITPALTADNAVSGYKPVIYLSEANASATAGTANFTGNGSFTVTGSALGTYTTCRLDAYYNTASGYVWQAAGPVVGTGLSGSGASASVTVTPYQTLGTISTIFPQGQQIDAVSCQ